MSAIVVAVSDWRHAASATAIRAAIPQVWRHCSGGAAPRPRCRISLHVQNAALGVAADREHVEQRGLAHEAEHSRRRRVLR
jgi:hypothetical protein